jgi:hypothetical protein
LVTAAGAAGALELLLAELEGLLLEALDEPLLELEEPVDFLVAVLFLVELLEAAFLVDEAEALEDALDEGAAAAVLVLALGVVEVTAPEPSFKPAALNPAAAVLFMPTM